MSAKTLKADGHDIEMYANGDHVSASINGVKSIMNMQDAEALLALLESLVNGYTD